MGESMETSHLRAKLLRLIEVYLEKSWQDIKKDIYTEADIEEAKRRITKGDYDAALALLYKCLSRIEKLEDAFRETIRRVTDAMISEKVPP